MADNHIVYVSEIKCGKGENSVFSFCYKNKMIDKPPFIIKAKNQYYDYNHHLDKGGFFAIGQSFPELYYYVEGKVNSYIDSMTERLYRLIKSGDITKVMSVLHNQDYTRIAVEWVGASPLKMK